MWPTSPLSTPLMCLSGVHAPRKGPPGGTMQRHRQEPADHDQRPCDDEHHRRCRDSSPLSANNATCVAVVQPGCQSSLPEQLLPCRQSHAAGPCRCRSSRVLLPCRLTDPSWPRAKSTYYMLGCGIYRTNTLPRPWSGYPKGLSHAVYDTSYPP